MSKFLDEYGLSKVWNNIKDLFAKKFTTDDTLAMDDDATLSVSTPVKGIISQDDFNKLQPDEQEKGVYFIHGNRPNISTYIVQKPGEIYSEDEVVIGTWIDGKPIYRIVLKNLRTPAVTGNWNNICAFDDSINNCIFIHGIVHLNTQKHPFPNSLVDVMNDAGYLKVRVKDSTYLNSEFEVTIEYTKTID